MKTSSIMAGILAMISLSLPACNMQKEHQEEHGHQKIVATSPEAKDVEITQQYVCQIHSQQHINVKALEGGYLEPILIREGQAVKQGELLFKIRPVLYKARMDAEAAEVKHAQLEFNYTKRLYEDKNQVVSQNEVALYEAKLLKAKAKLELAKAELDFTDIVAPFDGVIDRLFEQKGSLIKEGDVLTTLSDNSVMWVYFNVPEARYFEFKARQRKAHQGKTGPSQTPSPSQSNSQFLELVDSRIELVLANGQKFDQSTGNTVTVEGQFDNRTGNIPLRADFPNPERLLRHGQTGTILIHHTLHHATVIPQRATFELLGKRYVWVVGEDHVAHQRLLTIEHELEDIFVIKEGLDPKDKIVLEGVRQVHEGDKIEYDFRPPEVTLKNQKFYAE